MAEEKVGIFENEHLRIFSGCFFSTGLVRNTTDLLATAVLLFDRTEEEIQFSGETPGSSLYKGG